MGLYTPLSAPAKAVDTSLGQRIDALLTNTDAVALNSLAEIVAAFQAADGGASLCFEGNTVATNAIRLIGTVAGQNYYIAHA
jgi:hypothetical protein